MAETVGRIPASSWTETVDRARWDALPPPWARPLLVLGDAVTTDHISPVGRIAADSPAGRHLLGLGVAPTALLPLAAPDEATVTQ